MLQNIVEIHLFRCAKVEWFIGSECGSSCFSFPNLKELTLEDLVCLKRWSEINSEGQQAVKMFPLLEKLFIIRCENLTSMPGHPTFPSLLNARIEGCPNLTTRANSPVLSVLDVKDVRTS